MKSQNQDHAIGYHDRSKYEVLWSSVKVTMASKTFLTFRHPSLESVPKEQWTARGVHQSAFGT